MNLHSSLQYVAFIILVTVFVKPLGGYMTRVFARERTALDRVFSPFEQFIYRVTRVDPAREMHATEYATCFVLFSLAGTLLLYAILRLQHFLPWFFPQYLTLP